MAKIRKMTEFGKKIKAAGLSLYRISQDTGVSWTTLKAWASGRRYPRVSGSLTDVITYLEDNYGIDITFNDFKL